MSCCTNTSLEVAEDHTGIMPEIQFHLVPVKPLQELKKIHWEVIGMVSAVTVQGFVLFFFIRIQSHDGYIG